MRNPTTTQPPVRTPRLSVAAKKTTFAALTGLTLVGSLAGCSAADAGSSTTTTSPETKSTAAPEATTSTDAAAGSSATDYQDGSYTADGSYQSPNGTESITVTVTLAADTVTAVDVVSHAESANSKRYQAEFISGIAAEVVGKDIDSLKVSKVAGSSLTSGGFNAAIDTIKTEAKG
ncbi:FMN-binding protein [Plantibacter sp. MCCC 1A11337]|uniref:FMN-binding protein n=1 Tax=Plantibacter sp. MCCC 1A11337 TaxID=2736644 RepID=UPI00158412C2|nr:FMN-binding protein [Plantibacter sp. MCCC 1A11337]NUJ89385.1 FMN-binding protein [Plantibacter sp. MCCC 1A11337]